MHSTLCIVRICLKNTISPPPKTYADVIAAAEILKNDTSIEFPYGAAYKAGWNAAQEFNNIYQAFGGIYFESGSFKPSIENDKAVQTLELMARLKNIYVTKRLGY